MISKYRQGAIWRKWDLHIHTPASIVQGYGGDTAWEEFFDHLKKLPPEIKVVGINDYYFLDGFKRVMQEHAKGSFPNIEKFFPILEFRIDTFSSAGASKFNKINLHILFDIDDSNFEEDIKSVNEEFIAQIHVSKFHSTISLSKDNLAKHASDGKLKTGFSELIPSTDEVLRLLSDKTWSSKTITFLGYTEWNNLEKGKQIKLYKEHLYSTVNAFLTASEEDAISKKKEVLEVFGDKPIFQSLDIHRFDEFVDYKCLTWVKADPTFKGLKQALVEPANRIFIGSTPAAVKHQKENPHLFISSVKFSSSTTGEGWFDDIEPILINSGLVAIIGDKGNGKSALADSMGLAGGYASPKDFSFLCKTKFLKSSKHKKYGVQLNFSDGNSFTKQFSDARNPSPEVQRVKYLSQSFVNRLCDEVDEGKELQKEIDRVIFSHVPSDQRLGAATLPELIDIKSGSLSQKAEKLRELIRDTNKEIAGFESLVGPANRLAVVNLLSQQKQRLKTHKSSKPKKPSGSSENQVAIRLLEKHGKRSESLGNRIEGIDASIDVSVKNVHDLSVLVEEVIELTKSVDTLNTKLTENILVKDHNVDLADVLSLSTDTTSLQDVITKENSRVQVDRAFSQKAKELVAKIDARIDRISTSQSAANQKHSDYVVEVQEWKKQKREIVGSETKPNSIKGLEAEIERIDKSYAGQLSEKVELRSAQVKELLECIFEKEKSIKGIYSYVQDRAEGFSRLIEIPPSEFIEFLQEFRTSEGFGAKFFSFIAKNKSGTFYGDAESTSQLDALLPESSEFSELLAFPENVVGALTHNIAADPEKYSDEHEKKIDDQLRNGKTRQELYDFLFCLEYLDPRFAITYHGKGISTLSPGERGILLLAFYLLIDDSKLPIIIDQPEENVGNKTISNRLVSFVNIAKQDRQIITVTHNANLAIVCDAEQILHASMDQANKNDVRYESGSIEFDPIKGKSIDILEGTKRSFDNRKTKWEI